MLKRLYNFLQEIFLNVAWNFDKSPEMRLRFLRFLYYHNDDITTEYRGVKTRLQGFVEPQNYDYFERMLSAERIALKTIEDLPKEAHAKTVMTDMQELTNRVSGLIQQLQQVDRTATLHDVESEQGKRVAASRQELLQRIETAIVTQSQIPTSLLDYHSASSQSDIQRVGANIQALTSQLDDITASYDDVRERKPDYQRFLENQTEDTSDAIDEASARLRSREDS